MDLPTDKKPASESLKVTDKRLFTADGEIREEYRESVKPADASAARPPVNDTKPEPEPANEKKKKIRDAAENPGTPFTNLVEMLVMNAYVSLGLLRAPHQPPMKPDLAAARQMIDWISMLAEKTQGNLSEEEEEFLQLHLSDLKLKFVQLSRSL